MTPYPDELPLVEIKAIISMVKNGEIANNKATFAHSLWIIQGYAQSRVLGDPNMNLTIQATPQECCGGGCESLTVSERALAEMEKLTVTADGEAAPQRFIDWTIIMKYVVEKLLEFLLEQ
jgi:hypothetical protein